MSAVAEKLCTGCGLCCNGSLFAEVELASRREALRLETMGLAIDDSDDDSATPLLIQPCAALKNKRCAIYPHRPNCCRTFECRILQSVQRGFMTVDEAETQIARAHNEIRRLKNLLKQFPIAAGQQHLSLKERVQDTVDIATKSSSAERAKLESAFESLELFLQNTFLTGP